MSVSTHLYILRCGTRIKIGITNDIDKRLSSLQTGNSEPIILEYIEERYRPNRAEKWLHTQFAYCWVKGEWYEGIDVLDVRRKLMMYHDQD